MIKFILTILFAIFYSGVYAQDIFTVECENHLNVRAGNNIESEVIGTLTNGEQIKVFEINGEWAKIVWNNKQAYVNANYLTKANNSTHNKKSQKSFREISSEQTDMIFSTLKSMFRGGTSSDCRFLVYIILGLVVLSYLLFTSDNGVDMNDDTPRLLPAILLLLTSCVELYYNANEANFLWFCKEPRWWWIALNFLIFIGATFLQSIMLMGTTLEISYSRAILGLGSIPVGVVLLYIAVYFFSPAVPWIMWAFFICQIIQVIIILYVNAKYNNIFFGLFYAVVYVVALFATLMLVFHAIYLLIIVAIVLVMGGVLTSGGGSVSQKRSKVRGDAFIDSESGVGYIIDDQNNHYDVHSVQNGIATDRNDNKWRKIGGRWEKL